MFKHETIISPLDQFEIRNLFGVDTPLLGNINISITNIGLYINKFITNIGYILINYL